MFAADLVGALQSANVSQLVAVLDPEAPLVAFNAAVAVLPRPHRLVPGLRIDVGVVRGIRSLLRQWRPDIVQGHGGDTLKYAVMAAAGTGIPIVHRAIGMAPRWLRRGPRRLVYSLLMRRAQAVAAVAEAVAGELAKVFRLGESVVTIPNAVALSRMRPSKTREEMRDVLGIARDDPIVLSVAALTWEKDPLAHIEAIRHVFATVPKVRHLFVGEGPMRSEVDAAVRRAGLDGHVRLLGVRSDLPDLLAAADVLLLASRSDGMEGLPGIVIEAALSGVPTVGFDVAGVSEVVIPGRNGILVPPGDIPRLAAALIELLRHEDALREMGSAAQEWCLRRYEIRRIAHLYLDLYQDLCRDARQRRVAPQLGIVPLPVELEARHKGDRL